MRDKDKVKESRRKYNKRYYGRTANSMNNHSPWSEYEIDLVLRHDITDRELSLRLGRSVMSIQIKRCKEKKKRFNVVYEDSM